MEWGRWHYVEGKMHTEFWYGNPRKREYLKKKKSAEDGKIILE
jgi:hypothetical protein